MTYVSSRAVAEEVVQETWLGGARRGSTASRAARRCGRGSSSIAANIARSPGGREGRCRPFSSLAAAAPTARRRSGPLPVRRPPGVARPLGVPAGRVGDARRSDCSSRETRDVIRARDRRACRASQRLVVTLRDVEGWDAAEACAALEISAANQRVLLHRARAQRQRRAGGAPRPGAVRA